MYLSSAWNYRPEKADFLDGEDYMLKLDHLSPVFRLPNIRKLSLVDLEPLWASRNVGNVVPRSSRITELTLVHHHASLITDIQALLSLPKALTSLSI
jgi:hypothetical protein